jgi:hypothetical protein
MGMRHLKSPQRSLVRSILPAWGGVGLTGYQGSSDEECEHENEQGLFACHKYSFAKSIGDASLRETKSGDHLQ